MKRSQIISLVLSMGFAVGGSVSGQEALPSSSDGDLKPLVPEPSAELKKQAREAAEKGQPVPSTLRTTTVQSGTYNPNRKVSAEEYFSILNTTGSYNLNTDRAAAYQEAAIQAARQKKLLMEKAARTRHYRLPSDFASGQQYLNAVPPGAEPIPISSGPARPRIPSSPHLPPGAVVIGGDADGSINVVKINHGGGGTLAERIRSRKMESESGTNPVSELNSQAEPADLEASPDNMAPPAGPEVSVSEPQDIPEFTDLERNEEALNSPASGNPSNSRKGFFGKLFSRSNQAPAQPAESEMATGSAVVGNGVPAPPQVQPYNPESAPAPRMTSIFRPNATAQRANAYSIVMGSEVFANVNGEQVKLTEGTRVKVLRTGTDRSLVRLYDNRQATVPNGSLVPE